MSYRPIESRQDFVASVKLGITTESSYLELKAAYKWSDERPAQKQEHAIELCRDIAQFANADGGTLLVGVSEKETSDGQRVANTIVPVEDADGFIRWVEQAIRNNLAPSTLTRRVCAIESESGLIVAINVPPHVDLIAVWPHADRRGIEYLKRTNHGKSWMNPGEVEEHLMNGSRAVRLAAKRIIAATTEPRTVDLVPPVVVRSSRTLPNYTQSDSFIREKEVAPILHAATDDHVVLVMSPTRMVVHLPYELIRSMWVTPDNRPAMSLLTRIIKEKTGDRVDFYLDAL
jgi:hypothetical protein